MPQNVTVTVRFSGTDRDLEKAIRDDPGRLSKIRDSARDYGLIAHRFVYDPARTEIMALDVWPSKQQFDQFFSVNQAEIGAMLAAGGISGLPLVTYYTELDTPDRLG